MDYSYVLDRAWTLMTKKNDKKSGGGTDLIDKEDTKTNNHIPPKYKVIYHNDDFTPMELVTISLMEIFHHPLPKAIGIMETVHKSSRAIVGGPYSKDIAETKCNLVIQFFRSMGYPLL